MKPILPMLTLTHSILILAVATMAWLPDSLSAQEKGATKLMQLKSLKTVADIEAIQPGDSVAMACPKCKDIWITVVEKTAKGAGPGRERQLAQHQCPGCETIISAEGQGKAKTEVLTHVCKHCGSKDAFCSVVAKGSGPTAGVEKEKP
jgi:hypothetical protein